MAKTSAVNRNINREAMVKRDRTKRAKLKAQMMDRDRARRGAVRGFDEAGRDAAQWQPHACEAAGCQLTGRSRSNYRKFKLCRIALRDLASSGQIPGMVKASW